MEKYGVLKNDRKSMKKIIFMWSMVIFISSNLIAQEQDPMMSEDEQVDIAKTSLWSKWSLGIGYNGGICLTGEDFRKAIPAGQEFSFDLTDGIYWLNSAEGAIWYKLSSKYLMGFGISYIWVTLENRYSHITEPPDSIGEPWIYNGKYWNISGVDINLSFKKIYQKVDSDRFIEIKTNYYFTKGKDVEEAYKWDHTLHMNIVKQESVLNVGKGLGVSFNYGVEKKLSNNIWWTQSIGLQIGSSKEVSNNIKSPLFWEHPLSISFNGIWLKIGILIGGGK